MNPYIGYEVPPQHWPSIIMASRSAEGGGGVFFISDHAGNSAAIKPMRHSAPEVLYADKFIKNVADVLVPESVVYDVNSNEGRTLSILLSNVIVQNERASGELIQQIKNAKHFTVMERIQGEPLSKVAKDLRRLVGFAGDRSAMRKVGSLIVADSFLGSSDRLVFRDYSEPPKYRPDPINLDNIMYEPRVGLIAIDNEFCPAGNGNLLRSPNLHYVSALGDNREVNHLAYCFLSRLEKEFRRANKIPADHRIELLSTSLDQAHSEIVNGIYASLSKIGTKAASRGPAMTQEQIAQFPKLSQSNWDIDGLASYASSRFSGIDITYNPSMSHKDAVQSLVSISKQPVHGMPGSSRSFGTQSQAAAARMSPTAAASATHSRVTPEPSRGYPSGVAHQQPVTRTRKLGR
ncbi:hypothetical protein [Streptomyces sp. WAC 01325]|uniref:hypothetical protein n=1 Tax=Streptomyces sp. WAC 01325 TaxID=2203202 RepID=UPI000F8950FA|nr:hypothetical protein [Streptomyces sp. WAC 01325]